MRAWLRRLFCMHLGRTEFVRNIYGDEINEIEVKAGRDTVRLSQHAYRAMCESLGAVYLLARDVDGCLAELLTLLE